MPRMIVFLLFTLALASCTLISIDPDNLPPDGIDGGLTPVAVVPSVTEEPTTTRLPAPTTTLTLPTTSPTLTARPVLYTPNCVPNNTWPIYTVVAGDTLASIARATGTNVNQLTAANCLSDPNRIVTGQRLRVPRLPPPPPPGNAGYVAPSPYIFFDSAGYRVQANSTVTLSWAEARRDASRVDFLMSPPVGLGPVVVLGSDSYPADGATLLYGIPTNFSGLLSAIAYFANNTTQTTLGTIRVYAGDAGNVGQLSVSPYVRFENNRYILRQNQPVTFSWLNAPLSQATRVEFYFTSTNPSFQPQLLGTDNYLADGASIAYSVGTDFSGGIVAIAVLTNNTRTASPELRVAIDTASNGRVEGQVTVSPYLRTENGSYILQGGTTVTLLWPEAPLNEIAEVEFVMTLPDGGAVSLGIDNNMGDGVSLPWAVAVNSRGDVFATARIPNSTRWVESRRLSFRTETPGPPPPSFAGKVTVSPYLREDGGWFIVQVGTTITLTWPEAPISQATSIEFYLTPTGTGMTGTLIGTDTNLSDGASITWVVPASSISAHLSARAILPDGRVVETQELTQIGSE